MVDPNDVKSIFLAAIEKPPAERAAFLDQAAGGDDTLRQRVAALLEAHDDPDSFLDAPAAAVAATIETPLNAIVAEVAGSQVGPYKLLQQIGEGGMGVVFMAEQTRPVQRTVALKIIKPGMDTRQVIARFEAERQALAMMDHPNIAKVLDAGTTDTGRSYFVMDLVKGIPITEYCDQQHLSVRQRLELSAQVCHAVQHAHQKGIIHRDIKPSNVLVAEYDGKPVPRVIDFGVAKATAQKLTEKTMFTEFGQLIGTFEYMSPEQARFNQLDVDTRSDIYSLGVLLYELLTGQTPFDRQRLRSAAFDEVLRIIREEEPLRPSTRLSTSDALPSIAANRSLEPKKLSGMVRGELDWIVMRSLEKDRNRRYDTANALAADLGRYLTDQPVEACPPSVTYRLEKFVRRNKAGVLAGSAIAAALIVGLVLAVGGLVHARRQAWIAKTEADKATDIKNLLQGALESADVYASKGSGYTVRELMNDISADLGSKLVARPEVEVELRTTIGSAYRSLGDAETALPHLKRALELARHTYGPDDERVAPILECYSQALSNLSRKDEAEDAIRESLRIFRLHKQDGPSFLDAMSWYSFLLYSHGKIEEADAVGSEALATADASGNESSATASLLGNLAQVKGRQKENALAEQMARRAVEISRRTDGPQARTTANVYSTLGGVLADNKQYAEAEVAYREALAINRRACDPNHWAIRGTLKGLTEVLRAQGKVKALEELEAEQQRWAAAFVHRAVDALIDLFELHANAGEWNIANETLEFVKNFPNAEQYAPQLAKGYQRLALLKRNDKQWSEAEAFYQESLRLNPDDPDTHNGYGNALMYQQKWVEAEAEHRAAAKLRPAFTGFRFNVGVDLEAQKRYAEAEDVFRQIIRDVPSNPAAYERLSLILIANGKLADSEASLRNAIRQFPANPSLRASLIKALAMQEKSVELKSEYAQFFTLAPINATIYNSLAWFLAVAANPKHRHPELAVELAEKAVAIAPSSKTFHNTLGVAQYRAGDWKSAIESLETSIGTEEQGTANDWFFLAMAHWQLGHKDEARTSFDKAVESTDKNPAKNEELIRFRAEAAELLGISTQTPSTDVDKRP